MTDNEPNLLIIYTSKNGRTGSMVEPIRQGILEGGAGVAVGARTDQRLDDLAGPGRWCPR